LKNKIWNTSCSPREGKGGGLYEKKPRQTNVKKSFEQDIKKSRKDKIVDESLYSSTGVALGVRKNRFEKEALVPL